MGNPSQRRGKRCHVRQLDAHIFRPPALPDSHSLSMISRIASNRSETLAIHWEVFRKRDCIGTSLMRDRTPRKADMRSLE